MALSGEVYQRVWLPVSKDKIRSHLVIEIKHIKSMLR